MILFKEFRVLALLIFSALSLFVTSESVAQQNPGSIVVFGASLSDTGNAFVVLSDPSRFGFDETCGLTTPLNVPPYDTLDFLIIPDGAYAKGGLHLTNGATWTEQLARPLGLAGFVKPALRIDGMKARNYAVGGARAGDFDCRFNLLDQLDEYLADFSETSADTLIIIEIGGNDLRDALAALPADPTATITTAIHNIAITIQELYGQGARQFLIVNVPNFGLTPAVQILDNSIPGLAIAANILTNTFNLGLLGLQAELNLLNPEINVQVFDLYTLFNLIYNNPGDYGIEVIDVPCIMPNIPPYQCKKPNTYLFWDGIHATKAVHKIMAQEVTDSLLTP